MTKLALVSLDSSLELCIQYKITSSPTVAVVVDDQVVGASGSLPITTDFIEDHPECTLSEFTALTLKK